MRGRVRSNIPPLAILVLAAVFLFTVRLWSDDIPYPPSYDSGTYTSDNEVCSCAADLQDLKMQFELQLEILRVKIETLEREMGEDGSS